MRETFVDLHIHTQFSDGTFSLEEIAKKAKEEGLGCISITDHDCIDALFDIERVSRKYFLEIIPGVELTAETDDLELHFLGYFIEYKIKGFKEKLDKICQGRKKRILQMVERLRDIGISLDSREVFELSGGGSVGRLHLAQILQRKGFVSSTREAFEKFLGRGKDCFIPRPKILPQEAIEMIKKVGGIVVIAHPSSLEKDEIILELRDMGLEGIEVYHPDLSPSECGHYLNLARENHLLITGGSDCHGFGKGKVQLGRIKLPYELVVELKRKRGIL